MLFFSLVMYQQSKAQVSITINTGSQPAWGPVGYDYVDYYYMPDIDAYYYVPQQQFIYRETNNWVFARALPPRLKWYDPYHGYKVVINAPKPYLQHNVYRLKYKKYKGYENRQVIIRDSHDERYKNNGRGNSEHNEEGYGKHNDNGNGKNKGHGHGNGNGKGNGKHD